MRARIEQELKKVGISLIGSYSAIPEAIEDGIWHIRNFGYESWCKETALGAKPRAIALRLASEDEEE